MTGNEKTLFQSHEIQVSLAKILHTRYECGGRMVSIIFIYLAFSMGQQPYIPGDNSQMVVPSGHWYFSSGEKTSPEVPMTPLFFDACSACREGVTLFTFGSIPAVPSRQRLSILLTNGMACTCNTDEYPGLMHNCLWISQIKPTGQQLTRSGQQMARSPILQQPNLVRLGFLGQHFLLRHTVPSTHILILCNED